MQASLVFIVGLPAFATAAIAGPPRLQWSHDLPKEVATGAPPKHRTAPEVDAFFERALRLSEKPSIRTLIGNFGDPDEFSAEGYCSGGTLRWRLIDDGELRVVTDGAFQAVHWASRFDRKGKNKFLWK
jgi:hypothetical protein